MTILTEDVARTKWCCGPPMLMLTIDMRDAGEVQIRPGEGTCVASNCMAWRVVGKDSNGAAQGYCGLAGKP